jgi:hypothetical protein
MVDTSDASDVVEKQLMPEDNDWMKHNRQALIDGMPVADICRKAGVS